MTARQAGGQAEPRWPVLLPVSYALAVTVYIALRYGYRWGEQDSGQIVSSIRATIDQGTITPVGAYPHGYAYQAISAALGLVTGMGVTQLQLIVMPFLSLVVALMAFVAFRALTGSAIIGGLGALLLMIQPEFQFVIQRGSHEKVTHTLVLTLLFLLGASLARRPRIGVVAAFVLAFYLAAWALIATNSFFASSFIASLILGLVGGLVVLELSQSTETDRYTTRRLTYAVLSCFALLFTFITYVYRPASYNFGILRSVIVKLAVLFLSFEPQSNPYASLGVGPAAAWAAPWVYPLLTAFNWTVVALAALTWVWLGIQFWRKGLSGLAGTLLLVWLLAAAFAIEVLATVAADLSGNLAGSNLQIRLFPLFMLVGTPLAVVGVSRVLPRLPRGWGPVAGPLVTCLLAIFAVTGILKATNDPLVSNKWLFFTDQERTALAWTDTEVEHQQVWVGFDERLLEMQTLWQPPNPARDNRYTAWSYYTNEAVRYLAVSDVMRDRSPRLGLPLPNTRVDDRIFDDGGAQIYHRVPETPYQP